jgi:tRNA threonylcarbamoyladenosine biosynthesis protein TsaB
MNYNARLLPPNDSESMNILALDTSTECCSVAVSVGDAIQQRLEMTQRGHSDLILGMLDQLFAEAETTIDTIDVLAFGRGPGSFTGVRVGVAVAQGIAFARDIPVIPVSTLQAIAQDIIDTEAVEYVAVAIDARMGEIYCASYQNQAGQAELLDEERVCPPEDFKPCTDANWFGAGTGWETYQTELKANFAEQLLDVDPQRYPQAAAMLKLAEPLAERGEMVSADQAVPVYLRNNVAKKKGEQG